MEIDGQKIGSKKKFCKNQQRTEVIVLLPTLGCQNNDKTKLFKKRKLFKWK